MRSYDGLTLAGTRVKFHFRLFLGTTARGLMTRVPVTALSDGVFVLRRTAIMSNMKLLPPSCQWQEASNGANDHVAPYLVNGLV